MAERILPQASKSAHAESLVGDQLVNNLIGMCAFQGRSQDVPCWQTVRIRAEYCTACEAAERLKAPVTPPKYTADRDLPCAVCRVTIRQGEQVYKFGDWKGNEPHRWQHVSHLSEIAKVTA